MKRILLICALAFGFVINAQAQKSTADWKGTLSRSLSKEFAISLDTAKKLVDVKESYVNQVQHYNKPHVQNEMDKKERIRTLEGLRLKELNALNELVNDEAKAKEISRFLDGKIPEGKGGPRKR